MFSSKGNAQSEGVELWGGLRENMTANEVERTLDAKPEIQSAKVAKKESKYGDDVEIKYRSVGVLVGKIPVKLRLNMDFGKLRSVTLFPDLGMKPTCMSVGTQGFLFFDDLLAIKYVRSPVSAPTHIGLGEYTTNSFINGSTYVFNRLYVSSPNPNVPLDAIVINRCATSGGKTGTSSILYVGKAYYDALIQSDAKAAAENIKQATENL